MSWPFSKRDDTERSELFKDATHYLPYAAFAAVGAVGSLISLRFYKGYLRRIPNAERIPPTFLRKRSIFGRVTSVGDGDNFHVFHTPGGRLSGWGWARRVPQQKVDLRGQTASGTTYERMIIVLIKRRFTLG
jgi:hypothetical protein